jgi:beta-lactamase class A
MLVQDRIETTIEHYRTSYLFEHSVIVEKLHSKERFSHRPSSILPAASLVKLFVLASLLCQVSDEPDLWNQHTLVEEHERVGGSGIIKYMTLPRRFKLADLAEYMITFSDNIATNHIIDFLSIDEINRRAFSLGAESTVLNRKMMAHTTGNENMTSAHDVSRFYRLLLDESLPGVDPYWAQVGQGILLRSRHRDRLAKAFPPNCVGGTKSASGKTVIHDSGFFFLKRSSITIVVMIRRDNVDFTNHESTEYQAAQACFVEIGSALADNI